MTDSLHTHDLKQLNERLAKLEASQAQSAAPARPVSLTLMIYSDNYDKVGMAYTMALTAAAMGWQVHMFFAFWGISAARLKTSYKGKSLLNRMITLMTGKTLKSLSVSKFNMLGLGKHLFALMGPDKRMPDCHALAQEAAANPLITLTACSATVRMMGIHKHEMLEGVREGGMVTYLHRASASEVSYII